MSLLHMPVLKGQVTKSIGSLSKTDTTNFKTTNNGLTQHVA